MNDYSVHQYGVDSSGRPIYMTAFMKSVLDDILADRRVAPFAHKIVIIQGAFMNRVAGGGATQSSGYHNEAGCIDVRTRTLTGAELDIFIEVAREHAFAFWRRDQSERHGEMDPHAHGTLGDDYPLSPGATISWHSYVTGGDGLAGPGRDYEKRPNPLVLTPPEEDMALSEEDIKRIADAVWAKQIPTADAPEGRFIANAIAKLYNKSFPRK